MFRFLRTVATRYRLRRVLFAAGILLLATWLLFFDSHNIVKRIRWHHELAELEKRNEELQLEIDKLERQLSEAGSGEVVEEIAREQYGMRRPGERVYRVEQKDR